MIEDYAIACFITAIAVPCILGGIYAFITRPDKYYYKHDGWRWKKKRW